MSDLIVARAEILEKMNKYILDLGDEDIFDYWWQFGVPDSATFEDLLEYAEDDNNWKQIIWTFSDIFTWNGDSFHHSLGRGE